MKNKTVLVTGATDGIGKATAYLLAEKGARVIVHGRDEAKCALVAQEVNINFTEGSAITAVADFSSLRSVKNMADKIKRDVNALHVLVNNAGNFYHQRGLSEDGYELTFAVNHLAPFLLTLSLLELIKSSAPARIVNVSSTAHKSIRSMDINDLMGERKYDPFYAYGLSKLANVFFTQSLAEALGHQKVTANSLHPGVVDTKLLRNSYDLDGISVEDGAQTSVYLASSPEVAGISGKYFQNKKARDTSFLAKDEEMQAALWKKSLEMVQPLLEE